MLRTIYEPTDQWVLGTNLSAANVKNVKITEEADEKHLFYKGWKEEALTLLNEEVCQILLISLCRKRSRHIEFLSLLRIRDQRMAYIPVHSFFYKHMAP